MSRALPSRLAALGLSLGLALLGSPAISAPLSGELEAAARRAERLTRLQAYLRRGDCGSGGQILASRRERELIDLTARVEALRASSAPSLAALKAVSGRLASLALESDQACASARSR